MSMELEVSIEVLASLIYLARRSETHSAEQHAYLDRAAAVIEEMANRPPIGAPQGRLSARLPAGIER